jgi:hypothetical protein
MSDYIGNTIEKDFEKIRRQLADESEDTVKELDLSDPITFTEKYIPVPQSAPKSQTTWEFNKRPWLHQLYRDTNRRIIVVKGRQMEMSEFIVNQIIYHALKFPGIHTYSSATDEKVRRFSNDRLRLQILRSSVLAPLLKEAEVHRMVFGPSIIYLATAQNEFRSLLGIHSSQTLWLDEFQDTQGDALPMAEELLSHSEQKLLRIVGTPRLEGSMFYKYFNRSNKMEWRGEPASWQITNQADHLAFTGYHISQLLGLATGVIKQEDLDLKLREYPRQRYVNEVLGEFYAGLGRPLTEEMIEMLLDSTLHKGEFNRGETLLMGIDWGQGVADTAVVITRPVLIEAPMTYRYDIIFAEKLTAFNPDDQIAKAVGYANQFLVRYVIGDFGGGWNMNNKMWTQLGPRFFQYGAVTNPAKPMQWQATGGAPMLQVDATYGMDRAIDVLSKGLSRARIYNEPNENSTKDWLIKGLTANYPEVSEKSGNKIWRKDPSSNDDVLKAFMFTVLFFDYAMPRPNVVNPSDVVRFM